MSILIYSDQYIEVFHRRGNAPYAVITFSPATMEADGTNFWGAHLASKLDFECLGIVGRTGNWFPRKSILSALPVIRSINSNNPKCIAYGNSMGGYGALKYGRLLGATHSLAFAPQISISPTDADFDQRFLISYRPELHPEMAVTYPDLSCVNYVFYDPFLRADKHHALRIASLGPSVELIPAPSTGHEVITSFAGTANFSKLVELCLASKVDEMRELARVRSREAKVRPKVIAERASRTRPGLSAAIFRKFENQYSPAEQAVFWHKLSNSMRSPHQLHDAWTHSMRALSLNPNVPDFYMRLSEIADQHGNLQGAFDWARISTLINPARPQPYFWISKIELKMGRVRDSYMHACKALEIAPGHPSYASHCGFLAEKLSLLDEAVVFAEKAVENGGGARVFSDQLERLRAKLARG